jgi:hypothetical protein
LRPSIHFVAAIETIDSMTNFGNVALNTTFNSDTLPAAELSAAISQPGDIDHYEEASSTSPATASLITPTWICGLATPQVRTV